MNLYQPGDIVDLKFPWEPEIWKVEIISLGTGFVMVRHVPPTEAGAFPVQYEWLTPGWEHYVDEHGYA